MSSFLPTTNIDGTCAICDNAPYHLHWKEIGRAPLVWSSWSRGRGNRRRVQIDDLWFIRVYEILEYEYESPYIYPRSSEDLYKQHMEDGRQIFAKCLSWASHLLTLSHYLFRVTLSGRNYFHYFTHEELRLQKLKMCPRHSTILPGAWVQIRPRGLQALSAPLNCRFCKITLQIFPISLLGIFFEKYLCSQYPPRI